MLTEKQTGLNRHDKKSGGPRTPEGKRISSQNSFKTGLYAQSLIIQGERREDLETLQNEYYQYYRPQSPAERDLLDTMIRLAWQLRRYAHVEAELWDWEIYEQTSRGAISRHYPLGDMFSQCGDKFSRLQRMQNAAQSKFKDALHELQRLQAARPAEPIEDETISSDLEFVPSTLPESQSVASAESVLAAPAVLPPAEPEFVPSTTVETELAASQCPVPGPPPRVLSPESLTDPQSLPSPGSWPLAPVFSDSVLTPAENQP
jgi:hypothetical protein